MGGQIYQYLENYPDKFRSILADEVYQCLNIDLSKSYEEREKRKADRERTRDWTADTDPRATLSQLPPFPKATPDMLEGYEFEHEGLRLRRKNQGWVVVNTDVVDQVVREFLEIQTKTVS